MDTAVDALDNGIDPEAEVRKLQDLVKKLERQNQILRSKQNRDPVIHKPGTEESDVSLSKQNRTCANDTDNIKESFKKLTLEEVDLVDVDKVTAEEDEETWLFQSPKQPSPGRTMISPYKWLRHEFEHPSPEVDTARRLLLFKLDEMALSKSSKSSKSMSRSSSAGTLGSLISPTSAPSLYQSEHQQHDSSADPPATSSPPTSDRVSGLGSRVNTGTFTRPKKQQNEKRDPELIDDCNTSYINTGTFTRSKKLSPQYNQPDLLDDLGCTPFPVNSSTFTRPRKNKPRQAHSADELEADDEIENDITGYVIRPEVSDEDQGQTRHEHKFSDVTSLHVVARMQEESLRQSFSSPLMSPRRSEEYKSKCLSKDSLASTASSHSNSNTSSPPSSPYGSQYLDQKPHVSDTHRRSLPNLARSFNQGGLQMFQNDSRLQPRESPPRSLQKPGNMSRRARNPKSGARQGSPGRALSPGSPGRTLSPGRSGIPSPRSSGIPRPGGSSKLPQPRKSGIPSPRRSSNASRIDDSWKEGCY